MAAVIIGILSTQATLIETLVKTQTPAQQLIMWDRYIDLTTPLHRILCKLEGVSPSEPAITEPAAPASPAPASNLAAGLTNANLTVPAAASGPMPASTK